MMLKRPRPNRVAPASWALIFAASWPVGCSDEPAPRTAEVVPAVDTNADNTAAAAVPWFIERHEAAGVDYVNDCTPTENYYMPESITGGGTLLDMDGDGDLDLYLIQSGNIAAPAQSTRPNRLYENTGDGTFRDITSTSGDAATASVGMGATAGDYDNDGDTDIYITNLGANVLLRNDGGGRFSNVTEQAGVAHDGWGTSAAFIDVDRDGDLDLFVCNYLNWSPRVEQDCFNNHGESDYCSPTNYDAPSVDVLYRNNGDGSFTDVTVAAGIDQSAGNGLGIGCADFNGDGWNDIFVANDKTPDHLWINRGDGTFVEEALFAGCAVDLTGSAKAGMGVGVADVDHDADFDLLVCNLHRETDSLFLNEGSHFIDHTLQSGLGAISRNFTRFGLGWIDFNNDGVLDLYEANGRVMRQSWAWSEQPYAEPNILLKGTGDLQYEEVLPRGGTQETLIHSSRAALFGDLDNDGGVDIVVVNQGAPVHLLMNDAPDRGNWLLLRVLNVHGSDAIGAVVQFNAGDRRVTAQVMPAYSYLAGNDPRVHAGLGAADRITDVTVTWPDGTQTAFGALPANEIHTLRRGDGTPPSS